MSVRIALKTYLQRMDVLSTSNQVLRAHLASLPGPRISESARPKIAGIYHAGGPANTFNAVTVSLVSDLNHQGYHVFGFEDGCAGLLDGGRGVFLNEFNTQELQNRGGGLIGTDRLKPTDKDIEWIKEAVTKRWGLACLIAAGGDDTQSTANRLHLGGVPIIGIGKTVDDDLPLTDITYGHSTAYGIIGNELETLRNESIETNSNFLAEVMGRKSGALTMRASGIGHVTKSYMGEEFTQKGLSQLAEAARRGNFTAINVLFELADVVSIDGEIKNLEWIMKNIDAVDPETVFLDLTALSAQIHRMITERKSENKRHNVFAVAEGIAERLPSEIVEMDPEGLPIIGHVKIFDGVKTVTYDEHSNPRLGPLKVGAALAERLALLTGKEKKGIFEPGKFPYMSYTYNARCVSNPLSDDVGLSMQLGYCAAEHVVHSRFGNMIGFRNRQAIGIPFSELPVDPKTKKIIPRCIDLGTSEYLGIKEMQYFLPRSG